MKSLKLYLIVSTVLLVLYLVAQYYKPKQTDWTPTYLKEDKIPFGLYILDHELQDIFPGAVVSTSNLPVYNTLKDKNFKNTSYIFVTAKLKLDSLDCRELIRFMKAGNHVFMATYDAGKVLSKQLKLSIKSSVSFIKERKVAISFINPLLNPAHKYYQDRGLGNQYFNQLDTSRVTALGKDENGRTNFVKYTFGAGALYILPDPQLLTNYNLLSPDGADYAAKALSYLPVSKMLIMDEYSNRGTTVDSSILRVIFAHQPLAWAYTLAVSGLLLFVLFEMKRRQRIIPVIDPLKNSSVDFVKVVGRVYYQQRDNRDITEKKISYFLEFVRTNYRLKTTTIDDELAAALILKSGAPEETVKALFDHIHKINNLNKVTDEQLISINKLIEKFYKQVQ